MKAVKKLGFPKTGFITIPNNGTEDQYHSFSGTVEDAAEASDMEIAEIAEYQLVRILKGSIKKVFESAK